MIKGEEMKGMAQSPSTPTSAFSLNVARAVDLVKLQANGNNLRYIPVAIPSDYNRPRLIAGRSMSILGHLILTRYSISDEPHREFDVVRRLGNGVSASTHHAIMCEYSPGRLKSIQSCQKHHGAIPCK